LVAVHQQVVKEFYPLEWCHAIVALPWALGHPGRHPCHPKLVGILVLGVEVLVLRVEVLVLGEVLMLGVGIPEPGVGVGALPEARLH
jgi:hypothetical protein